MLGDVSGDVYFPPDHGDHGDSPGNRGSSSQSQQQHVPKNLSFTSSPPPAGGPDPAAPGLTRTRQTEGGPQPLGGLPLASQGRRSRRALPEDQRRRPDSQGGGSPSHRYGDGNPGLASDVSGEFLLWFFDLGALPLIESRSFSLRAVLIWNSGCVVLEGSFQAKLTVKTVGSVTQSQVSLFSKLDLGRCALALSLSRGGFGDSATVYFYR